MFEANVYTSAGPAPVIAVGTRIPQRFTGTVSAVYDHALNIRIDGDPMIVALVTRRSGQSARALLVGHLPHGLSAGARVTAAYGSLYAGDTQVSGVPQAPLLQWKPDETNSYDGRIPAVGADAGLEIGTEMRHRLLHSATGTLRGVLSDSCAGNGGFVSLLGMGLQDPFALRAAEALAEGRAEACVGLGIGLTPSGDDFLTGAILTGAVLGIRDNAVSRERIGARLSDRSATTDVSGTQLRLALDGHAPAFLLPLLEAVVRFLSGTGATENIRVAAREATSHGHSSGCDTVVGLVWTLERMNARIVRSEPDATL